MDQEKAVHGGRPIPNKISLWLTGVPIRALRNVKMFKREHADVHPAAGKEDSGKWRSLGFSCQGLA
eukprot:4856471-Amphidinium_carterae.1